MDLSAIKANIISRGLQAWLLLLRQEIKHTRVQSLWLQRRNLYSKASILSPEGPVVSLTSHGSRLETVHLTVESIGAGTLLPSRFILWVDNRRAFESPSSGIRRLIERGLEFRLSENYGPHTKYYPYVESTDKFNQPLAIADDDILYTKWWLRGLVKASLESPNAINCYRAHRIRFTERRLASYSTWGPCMTTHPSFLHFATGVSGCIYPASLLQRLKTAGSEFIHVCPKADDVWLHANALRSGLETRQIWNRPLRFPCIPGTQDVGLFQSNHIAGQNDSQIDRTYKAEDIACLRLAYMVNKGSANIELEA